MVREGSAVRNYWRTYLDSLRPEPPSQDLEYEAWAFGNTSEMADNLGDLVKRGVKIATASLAWAYEAEGEPYPDVGGISIILDGRGDPMCIIETTGVEVIAFNSVGEKHAYEEGEGDRSLDYWREVHWAFFAEECRSIGREPAGDMPVVCEKFRLLYSS
ncbi:MAG: ASCH domain-containing protein [Anaerolineales bacterium]|nr:ASCH domain-containing protein [Anaerolineales bacterium]